MILVFWVSWPLGLSRHHGLVVYIHLHEKAKELLLHHSLSRLSVACHFSHLDFFMWFLLYVFVVP